MKPASPPAVIKNIFIVIPFIAVRADYFDRALAASSRCPAAWLAAVGGARLLITLLLYLHSDVGTKCRLERTRHGNHLLLHPICDNLCLCKALGETVRTTRHPEV